MGRTLPNGRGGRAVGLRTTTRSSPCRSFKTNQCQDEGIGKTEEKKELRRNETGPWFYTEKKACPKTRGEKTVLVVIGSKPPVVQSLAKELAPLGRLVKNPQVSEGKTEGKAGNGRGEETRTPKLTLMCASVTTNNE